MNQTKLIRSLLVVGLLTIASACTGSDQNGNKKITLKDAFEGKFSIGVALSPDQYKGLDERATPIIKKQFNSITPENDMKWMHIHPESDVYFFDDADDFVEFGEEHDMFIIGHTLVWHSQTPRWVFEDEHGDPLTRDALLARMEDHIKTVMGRYKGRVDGWDVVNEALNDDGTMRESPWYTIIGEDYLAKAFQFAKEADPEAELYYNDYNLHLPAKADAAVALVRSIQEQGIEVTGIGMQGHYGMDYPTAEDFDSSITKFKKLGVVAITELDIDVLPSPWEHMGADVNMTAELRDELNPFTKGLPDSVLDVQTRQFEMLFKVMLEHADAINRVTLWGVTDGDSWKNGWPMPGRTNYPLLFDRNGKPKPAVPKIVELAK